MRVIFSFSNRLLVSIKLLVFPLVSILFTLATNLSYTVFLTTSFLTTLLSLLKSAEIVFNLSTSILFTSVFKLTKSNFATNLEVSILVAFFKSAFVAKLFKSSLIKCLHQEVHML